MKKYVMGIDNGGSEIKCAVFSLDGTQISVAREQVQLLMPHAGWTERDAEEVWNANVKVIKEVLTSAGIDGGDIAAIGLTGYGNGIVLTDKNGRVIYPVIVSTDERATEYCERYHEDGTEAVLFPYTRQELWEAQPAVLLPWFRDNLPQVYRNIGYVLSLKDYIRFRLTGTVYGEITDASSGALVNLDTRRYEPEIFRILGIEECFEKMPQILESTDISGYVTQTAAGQTGLKAGIPVAAGYFDIDANALASSVLDPDVLCLIAGTWSINEYLCEDAPREYCESTATLSYLEKYFLIEDSSPTSASNFNWYLRTFFKEELPDKQSLYRKCNNMVKNTMPEESRVIFVPYLFGNATHPEAKSGFLNINGADEARHLLRAVYEGIAFSTLHHVMNLGRELSEYKAARLSGGVTNSEVWTQMFCDILQIPIEALTDEETGAKGAAIGASVCCGIYKDVEEAAKKMVHIKKKYIPNRKLARVYRNKFKNYEAALEAVDLLAERIGE